MGMRLKLREYKAHPVEDPKEREARWNQAKGLAALILGIAAPIVVVGSILANGQPRRLRVEDKLRTERLAAAQATSKYIVPSADPEFFYHNWGHFQAEERPGAGAREAREFPRGESLPGVYEELRGLAVYEVPEGAPEPEGSAASFGIPQETRGAFEAAQDAQGETTRKAPEKRGGGS